MVVASSATTPAGMAIRVKLPALPGTSCRPLSRNASRNAVLASNEPLTGAEVLPATRAGSMARVIPDWLAIWFRVDANGPAGRL